VTACVGVGAAATAAVGTGRNDQPGGVPPEQATSVVMSTAATARWVVRGRFTLASMSAILGR
jgi:hypothetical protein